jgi:hypothetical protein
VRFDQELYLPVVDMSRPNVGNAGRRTDSLFDNRYRYDLIFPRGRSGEVLRAYDTLDGNRPVVIKRPAPQDAPPLRAGQEMSILNEKRALERLSGHAALAELLRGGTFRVGGQTHQYLVIELADGSTIEDYVLTLAARGERLPDLETLVIMDRLLDLLETAHTRQIACNDVDAKHLYWDRAQYRLKVIDWGNAVFLDADNRDSRTDPARAWRAIDAAQAVEVLYFIMSGGRRLDTGHGSESLAYLPETLSTRVKAVFTRATDAESARRYPDVMTLRRDLAEARRPLEKSRDQLVERVRAKLPNASSQDELTALATTTSEALAVDPGFPAARTLQRAIESQLNRLAIQGDLDAARIYIESGSPHRAQTLLTETLTRAGESEQPLVGFMLDAATQLLEAGLIRPPAGLAPALDALFKGDPQTAGRALVTTPEARAEAYAQQLLLAERLTLRIPGVMLLRPHLTRLDQLLIGRSAERGLLTRLVSTLDLPTDTRGVQPIREVYAQLAEALGELGLKLNGDAQAASERARQAATKTADLLGAVSQTVLADPKRAADALWQAGAIDPVNNAFDLVSTALNAFHVDLETLSNAVPSDTPADLLTLESSLDWLYEVQTRLTVYEADLPDPQFAAIRQGVAEAIAALSDARDVLADGGRRPAMTDFATAANAIRLLNGNYARRFDETVRQIEEARYVEALSPNQVLGQALSEGWEAWDRGKNAEAQIAAERARAAATTTGERAAADRLARMATITADWLGSDGLINRATTERALADFDTVLTPAERQLRQKFTDQMPTMTIYLKAMVRGLVEPLRDASSAAGRLLLVHYTLRGVLALIDEQPDTMATWREAANRTVANVRLHPVYQVFEQAITRRQLLNDAARALNTVQSLAEMNAARSVIRAPMAAAQLDPAEQAFRAIEEAVRRWADGDFRAARQMLESAADRIISAERAVNAYFGYGSDSPRYLSFQVVKNWIGELHGAVDDCQTARQQIEQAALIPANEPDPLVDQAHALIVSRTRQSIGEENTAIVRQWRDTYQAVRQLYEDTALDKGDQLRLFDGHFTSLFIDRHPAYPIYRHWQSVIALKPDPQPVYSAAPAITNTAPAFVDGFDSATDNITNASFNQPTSFTRSDAPSIAEPPAPPESHFPWLLGGAVGVAAVIVVVIGFLALSNRTPPTLALTLSPSPNNGAAAIVTTAAPVVVIKPTDTLTASATLSYTPSATATITPTNTPVTPTLTSTITLTPGQTPLAVVPTETPLLAPTKTLTPSITPSATGLAAVQTLVTPAAQSSISAIATVPSDAPPGQYNLLPALASLNSVNYTWTSDLFAPAPNAADNSWQLGSADPKAGSALLLVRIGPSALGALYGPQASKRVVRVDATVTITGYDPALMATGQVYVGVGLEAGQGQRATGQIKLIQAQVVTLGTTINGKFTARSQVPTSTLRITLSAQRNSDHTVSLYADGQLLGTTPNAVYGPTTPLSIVLYTSGQSVIATVNAISIRLG